MVGVMTHRFLMLLIAFAALTMMFFVACGDRTPIVGEVVEKEYVASRTWTSTYWQKIGNSKMLQTRTHYEPERFVIHVNVCSYTGDCKIRKKLLSESYWNDLKVGDRYEGG